MPWLFYFWYLELGIDSTKHIAETRAWTWPQDWSQPLGGEGETHLCLFILKLD